MLSSRLCRVCLLPLRVQPILSTTYSTENFHPRNESVVKKRARLLWQSRKRGITENCLIFSTFADKHLHSFNEEQLSLYDQILNEPSNEWDIYYWMVGTKPVPQEYSNTIMDMLREHCKNQNKEERFVQPPPKYQPVLE